MTDIFTGALSCQELHGRVRQLILRRLIEALSTLEGLLDAEPIAPGKMLRTQLAGRLIESGALGRPVREVTIATDFLSLLSSIIDLAGEPRWIPLYGSVCTPSLAVERITVSGS